MSLIELMVALAILSLTIALALSSLAPWLAQARRGDAEAGFWRALPPSQLVLFELAAGAVDAERTFHVSATQARLRSYAPRLAPAPIDITLTIETHNDRARLVLTSPTLERPSVLLDDAPPLRFAPAADALVLEARLRNAWSPLTTAPIPADAPLVCGFDLISRDCR